MPVPSLLLLIEPSVRGIASVKWPRGFAHSYVYHSPCTRPYVVAVVHVYRRGVWRRVVCDVRDERRLWRVYRSASIRGVSSSWAPVVCCAGPPEEGKRLFANQIQELSQFRYCPGVWCRWPCDTGPSERGGSGGAKSLSPNSSPPW